ncbi:hypothetical protein ASG52_00805 [Methylobacterium sp. Leaf456]|uniref:DUF2339 domain-containing protein n=1 Tax=Methylobacterium sp. Leaf456 TaxID=1736382 RepID=UPI0006F337D2|nr:DUF2339 domain-containing protein [Methylobacterium sp. Leaf456]KQT61462.1 hypothetical protein ASG52_00805 [Methylobacterium sp. Leaf456]
MDDSFFLLLALLGLALAVAGPAGLLVALGQRGRIAALERRIARLEGAAAVRTEVPQPEAPRPEPRSPEAVPVPPRQNPNPAVTPPKTAPKITSPAQRPPVPRPSLEERFGTRWTVWVGGLALAFGAALLVRYSAERGFFGPGVRVAGAVLLALGLLAAGEFLRRRLRGTAPTPPNWPDVPAVVTSAGTVALFGALYAAHALYGFLGPLAAFSGLAATGLAAMAAALLHGPALAGIGLVGAMATPLLVGGGSAGVWPLALYLPVVAGSAYGFAWLKGWRALAVAGGLGAAAWSVLMALHAAGAGPAQAHLVLQGALAALVLAMLPGRGVPDPEARLDRFAAASLAAFTLVAGAVLGLTAEEGAQAGWIAAAFATVALPAAAGFLAAPAALGLPVAALALAGVLVVWPEAGEAARDPLGLWHGVDATGALPWFALVAAALVAGAGTLRLLGGSRLPYATALAYAAGAGSGPLAALGLAYLRLSDGGVAPGFAAVAGALAALFCGLAAAFRRQGEGTPSPALTLGLGAFASAAVAALCLGLVFALSGGSLTPALAGAALATGLIARRLDIPALRWCVAGLAALVAARLAWDPLLTGPGLSGTPILNGLLIAYGLPALCLGLAAWVIRRGAPDVPEQVTQAVSLVLAGLLVFLQIRHALHGGDLTAPDTSLVEQGLTTLSALGFSLVLGRVSGAAASPVIRFGGLAFAALALLQGALGLGLAANPALTDEPVAGGLVFNDIVLAYGAPALAALALARAAQGRRPVWFVRVAGLLGLGLAFLGTCLAVRHGFQGERIGLDRETGQPEWYAYSAAWLVLGLLALADGIRRGSTLARLASAVLVGLATLKAFLFDLAGLEGPLRALSFLGLGACLIGIGLVYQRLVFARPAGEPG